MLTALFTFRCDACGAEAQVPWEHGKSLPVAPPGWFTVVGSTDRRDFCPEHRAALEKLIGGKESDV